MKKLLVITYPFVASTVVSAQRPLRLIRKISEFGWQPHVLTTPPGCQASVELDLIKDVLNKVDIYTVPCWSIWNHSKWWRQARPTLPRLFAMATRLIAKYTQPLVPLDFAFPWVVAAVNVGVRIVREHDIDLIWSTAKPLTALYLAERIHAKTKVPFIADFRDVDTSGKKRWFVSDYIDQNLEERILHSAAGITYSSPSFEPVLRQKHPFLDSKPSAVIHNWFEKDEISKGFPNKKGPVRIIHGGSLYGGNRDLTGLFDALGRLNRNTSSEFPSIQFVQYCDGNWKNLRPHVDRLGVQDAVSVRPRLPRAAFLSECRKADILLLVVGHDQYNLYHSGAIPGKLVDYLASCRPILVVGPSGCTAGEIVTRLRRGLFAQDDHVPQIIQAVRSLLNGYSATERLDLTLAAVKEFESDFVVKKLAAFFEVVYRTSKKKKLESESSHLTY